MQHDSHSSLSHRRGFLQTLAWIAGAIGIALPGKLLAQETKSECSGEAAKVEKAGRDSYFEGLRDKARYVRRLREKLGPKVLDEVAKLNLEEAESRTKNADIPQQERNLGYMKKTFARVGELISYTWVEDTPERIQARVTHCRWADELKKDGNDGEVGLALVCAGDAGYCAGVNPKMKFSRTKTLMMGDACCDHTYELKS